MGYARVIMPVVVLNTELYNAAFIANFLNNGSFFK